MFSSNGSGNPNISNADGCGGKSIRMYENVHIEINRGWNERMFNTVCYKYYLIVKVPTCEVQMVRLD